MSQPKYWQYNSIITYTYLVSIWRQLENKGKDEVLRHLVKRVILCDILRDPPLLVPGYEGPYDIIFSSLCLISACTTHEEYSQAIGRLTKYLKPGGKLILQSAQALETQSTTIVTLDQFFALSVTPEFLTFTLTERQVFSEDKDVDSSRVIK